MDVQSYVITDRRFFYALWKLITQQERLDIQKMGWSGPDSFFFNQLSISDLLQTEPSLIAYSQGSFVVVLNELGFTEITDDKPLPPWISSDCHQFYCVYQHPLLIRGEPYKGPDVLVSSQERLEPIYVYQGAIIRFDDDEDTYADEEVDDEAKDDDALLSESNNIEHCPLATDNEDDQYDLPPFYKVEHLVDQVLKEVATAQNEYYINIDNLFNFDYE